MPLPLSSACRWFSPRGGGNLPRHSRSSQSAQSTYCMRHLVVPTLRFAEDIRAHLWSEDAARVKTPPCWIMPRPTNHSRTSAPTPHRSRMRFSGKKKSVFANTKRTQTLTDNRRGHNRAHTRRDKKTSPRKKLLAAHTVPTLFAQTFSLFACYNHFSVSKPRPTT